LAQGSYALKSASCLRGDDKDYSKLAELSEGVQVDVLDKGTRNSLFKAGWFLTNEHSWSQAPGGRTGWIDDSDLEGVAAYVFSRGARPTADLIKSFLATATPEQKKKAANDDGFLARAKKVLDNESYLQMLPALGVHRTPEGPTPPGKKGPGGKGHLTGPEADAAIQSYLQGYLAKAIQDRRTVTGEVSVVGDEDFQAAFDRQWVEGAKQVQYKGQKASDICDAFVDVNLPKRHIWVHRNFGDRGTVVHEGMHKYADPTLRDEQIKLCNDKGIAHGGTSRLDEGITEYFTRLVVINQLKMPRADYYAGEYRVAAKLAGVYGEPILAKAYFDGAFDSLKSAFKGDWATFAEHLETEDWDWLKTNNYL
jgi:hypothetical protein